MKSIIAIAILLLSAAAQAGEYTVQPQDTLCKIASAYHGLTAKALYRTNKQMIDKRNQKLSAAKRFWVYPGQTLQIPSGNEAKKTAVIRAASSGRQIKRDANGVGQWKTAGGNAFGQRNPIQALGQLPSSSFADQDKQTLIKTYGQPAKPFMVKPGQLFDWVLFGDYHWQEIVRWSGPKDLEAEIWPEAILGDRACRLLRTRLCNNLEIICQTIPATAPVIPTPESTPPSPAEKGIMPVLSPPPPIPPVKTASPQTISPFPPVPLFTAASSAKRVNVRPPKELPKAGEAEVLGITNYQGGSDLKVTGFEDGTINLLIPVSSIQEFYSSKDLAWSIDVSMAHVDGQRWVSIGNSDFSISARKKENDYLPVAIKFPASKDDGWFWVRITGHNNMPNWGVDSQRLWINLGSAYLRLDTKGYPAYELLVHIKNRTFLAVPPMPASP
jgi:LysM repeat protein